MTQADGLGCWIMRLWRMGIKRGQALAEGLGCWRVRLWREGPEGASIQ